MPAVGDRLVERYRILAPLGSGGMATVWRAHDERLDRDVAVKVLLPNLASDPVTAQRFEQEARAMAAIAHPGLVAVFDVDAGDQASGGEPFVVMELCTGGSLADRFSATGRMAPDDLIPIVVAVADALAALHRAGFVHRDIKPANILFASDRVKLGDFGLARADAGLRSEAHGLTEPGMAVGTLAYLAPERLRGDPAGPPADVYALATVAYLGLTGALPRPTASIRDAVAAAAFRAPAVSQSTPELGRSFDEIVGHALAIDPGRRPDPVGFGAGLAAAFGRWSRAGRPGAPGPARPDPARPDPTRIDGVPAPAAPVPVDEVAIARAGAPAGGRHLDDATTAVAIPAAATAAHELRSDRGGQGAIARESEAPGDRTSPGGRLVVGASAIVAVLLGAVIVAGLASRLQGGPGGAPSATPAGPGASSAASTGPTARAASSTPAPPTADPALAALDAVERAIAAARGGSDGLKGKEANELEDLVRRIRTDLQRGDRDRALADARRLEDKVRDVTEELNGGDATRLRSAAADLVAALGG